MAMADDPAHLPLFTQIQSTRPGRVRSTFLMRNNPVASRKDLTEAVSPPDTVRVTTAPQGWGQPRAAGRRRIGMDWSLVARLRAQASERLSASLGEEPGHLNRDAQQELGRSIIVDLLQTEAQQPLSAGNGSWSMAEQEAVATAVFDALFGLGRLQPLVDDDRIENIIITGHDTVRLELTDGSIEFTGRRIDGLDPEDICRRGIVRTSMLVPVPASERSVKRPPRASARSRMLTSPKPPARACAGSKPLPSSAIRRRVP